VKQFFYGLVAAMTFAGAANASALLAAGSLFGGASQTTAVCYIFNAGPNVVALTAINMLNAEGSPLTLTVHGCGASLPAGQSCGIAASIAGNQTYSCVASFPKNPLNMRGIMEVRDSSQSTLANTPLR
jgi:hypothetical protein